MQHYTFEDAAGLHLVHRGSYERYRLLGTPHRGRSEAHVERV